MQSCYTGDGLLGTYFDDKLPGTLALGENGAFATTIGTTEIGYGRDVSIYAAALGYGLAVSTVSSVSSFS